MRLLWILVASLTIGCASSSASPAPAGWAPVAGIGTVTIADEPHTYAELLGVERERIESAMTPTGSSTRDAWAAYGDDVRIAYREGRAVRIRVRTPQQFGCLEAARWMGFAAPREPRIDGPRCSWPGALLRHRLEKGYGGEYHRDTQWFWIWPLDAEEVEPDRLERGHIPSAS